MKPLWFRHPPEQPTGLPPLDPPLIQTVFGEKIVQLRGDIQKARTALDRGDVGLAKDILAYALHEGRWGE